MLFRSLKFQPAGQFVCNTVFSARDACLDGIGLAYIPKIVVEEDVKNGALISVLEPFCLTHLGFHLFYPRHHRYSMPLSLFVEEMKVK